MGVAALSAWRAISLMILPAPSATACNRPGARLIPDRPVPSSRIFGSVGKTDQSNLSRSARVDARLWFSRFFLFNSADYGFAAVLSPEGGYGATVAVVGADQMENKFLVFCLGQFA